MLRRGNQFLLHYLVNVINSFKDIDYCDGAEYGEESPPVCGGGRLGGGGGLEEGGLERL